MAASRLKPADIATTSKRARSTEQSKPATPTVESPIVVDEEASLPPFLTLKAEEIETKFEQIDTKQKERLEHHRKTNDPGSPWAQLASNSARIRNRYLDIKPWDKTRVKLRVPEGVSDYINASPIVLECSKTGQKRRYIATQGPRESGVEHFWQMVWHETQDTAVVIMLTQLQEGPREKCFQYFPENTETSPFQFSIHDSAVETNDDGDKSENSDSPSQEQTASLSCKDSTWNELCKTTVRTLQIDSQDGRSKTVHHLFFLGWPDYGVPVAADRAALLELIKLSREKNCGWDNPRIVHCSAGVGRTGSFIALEHLLAELDVGALEGLEQPTQDPIFDTVDALRQQRMTMVQSEQQYHFLYELLREATKAKSREKLIAEKMQGMSTGLSPMSPGGGEPVHKAMRFTRAVRGVFSELRDRSSSRKRDSRKNAETPPPRSASEGPAERRPVSAADKAGDGLAGQAGDESIGEASGEKAGVKNVGDEKAGDEKAGVNGSGSTPKIVTENLPSRPASKTEMVATSEVDSANTNEKSEDMIDAKSDANSSVAETFHDAPDTLEDGEKSDQGAMEDAIENIPAGQADTQDTMKVDAVADDSGQDADDANDEETDDKSSEAENSTSSTQ